MSLPSSLLSSLRARRQNEEGNGVAAILLMAVCVGGITLAVTLPVSLEFERQAGVEEMKATVESTVAAVVEEYPDLEEELQKSEGPSDSELAVLPLNLEGEKGDNYQVMVETDEAGFWIVQGVHDDGTTYSFDSRMGQFFER